tara:strand:+ start:1937 stop:2425 length:489 start_codon:yes stop_codon:yes gene_type:complete
MSNEIIDKALGIDQIDPDKRVWEYDDDGTKIYKVDQGYPTKTPYEISSQEITSPSQENRNNTNNDHVESDYEYQRQNFYNLVERGTDAVEGILELAKESDHPRAYEVAGNLIKQVAEVTEKLGDLQEKMRKLKEVPNNAPKSVTNALFVGSTAELQKMLKDK